MLLFKFLGCCLCFDISYIKPYFLPCFKHPNGLSYCCFALQGLMGLFFCFGEFSYPFFYCREFFISFGPVCLRVTSHDEVVGCEMCSFMFPGVVSEFSYREICCPVGLSSIYELSQVCFNPLIHAFTLSICSRVKHGTKVLFDPHVPLSKFVTVQVDNSGTLPAQTFAGSKEYATNLPLGQCKGHRLISLSRRCHQQTGDLT